MQATITKNGTARPQRPSAPVSAETSGRDAGDREGGEPGGEQAARREAGQETVIGLARRQHPHRVDGEQDAVGLSPRCGTRAGGRTTRTSPR